MVVSESDSKMTWDSSSSLASRTPFSSAINSVSRHVYCPGSVLLMAATASHLTFCHHLMRLHPHLFYGNPKGELSTLDLQGYVSH